MSLTAVSANLNSKGRILRATSMASRLEVLGSPRHRDNAFLCTLSRRVVLLLHCQIVEPYSIIVLTRVLYSHSNFLVEIRPIPFTSLIILRESEAFFSVFCRCSMNVSFSSRVMPGIFGVGF